MMQAGFMSIMRCVKEQRGSEYLYIKLNTEYRDDFYVPFIRPFNFLKAVMLGSCVPASCDSWVWQYHGKDIYTPSPIFPFQCLTLEDRAGKF